MEFAKNFKKLREQSGFSQEELADKMDVSRQSVSKWETGEAYPKMEHIFALTDILDCRLSDLVGEEEMSDEPVNPVVEANKISTKSTERYQPIATQSKSDHARYNRTWFINALAEATSEPIEKCIQLDEILESNFWFGKRQRAKVQALIMQLGYGENRADEILTAASKILSVAFRDRLRHPFRY